jgi:hypothetical protein
MMFEDNTFYATPLIERYLAELLLADLGVDALWQISANPQAYKRVLRAKLI